MFSKVLNEKCRIVIAIILISIFLLLFLFLCIPTFPYLYFLFDDTTITFQNNSGKLIHINATIVELEQDDFEWKYESEIKNGDKSTLEVDSGLKRIKYTVDQTEGEIELDMWKGEDVILVIESDKTITTDYGD